MARKKTTLQERQARAAANGYKRGAHREKDSIKDENKHTADTIELQERALTLYREWMTEDGHDQRSCLAEEVPAPDLATIKDFIRYYIDSSRGRLSLKLVVSSVLNFAERFFVGFTRVTRTTFDPSDTTEVYHWIRRTLTKEGIIEDKKRPKNLFSKRDLIELLISIWTLDDPMFIHERNRVQLTFTILIFCFSGARISAFIPNTDKAKDRGIRYKDIELFLQRIPDGSWILNYRLDQRFVKNNRDPKNATFGIPFTEHETFKFNTVLFLLALAFADNALFGYSSLSDLGDQEIPEGDDELPLRWNEEALERPILRAVTAGGVISDSMPLTRVRFCEVLRAALQNVGFFGRITIHTIRHGLANKVDKRATEAERSQLFNQTDPKIFGRSYIANVSSVDGQAAFLDEPARTSHIEYLQGVSRFQEKGLPSRLPAEIEHSILENAEVLELETRIRELIKGSADEIKISTAKSKLKLRRKQLRDEALSQHREEWVQKRRDWKILSRGKERIKDPINTEITQDLFRLMPERARLAEMMTSEKRLSMKEKLKAVEDLLSLCTRDLEVVYRPKEEPINKNVR
ncbi:MAG: hypothetical protein M1840_002683 [Geoglossum simile]|nr:MAG: hypothetical protein M1840_002683 [Geoglossum simile]